MKLNRLILPLVIICGVVLLDARAQGATPPARNDVRRDATVEAVQRVVASVVNIRTETVIESNDPYEKLLHEFFGYRRRGTETTYSIGSGVIIDEEGWVLTNFHVVGRATKILVRLTDGREVEAVRVVGTSFTDVALLKIQLPAGRAQKFSAIKFASDDDLLLGETVLALGNPFGLGGSVSRGILSSKSRRPAAETDLQLEVEDWLQTDAAINPGNSGGPLVNLRGELIGINVAVYREGQGIGFAIPVKRVSAALSEIYSPENLSQLWLGARIRPSLPLTITSVQPESPAAKAGLLVGDQIVQLNGKAPTGFIAFNRELTNAGTQRNLSMLIERGTSRLTATVRMVPESVFFNPQMIQKKIGASVQDLTPALAKRLGLRFITQGLIISGVELGSSAARANLQENMIITAVDGQITPSAVDAAKKLHAKRKGEMSVLDLTIPRRRGQYIEYQQAKVELTVQ